MEEVDLSPEKCRERAKWLRDQAAEAQRAAVAAYLNGGNWRITGEYTEVESGKRSDRPQLDRALAAARVLRHPSRSKAS
jgi:hypothetical protein